MIFETKKIPIETLGEYLTHIRESLGLSVAKVAENTGIGDKFLQYIEAGSYHRLPPDVYVFGFLKKMAEIYSISPDILLEQYKKERGIVEQLASEKIATKNGVKSWFAKMVVTPKLISLFGGIGLSFIAVFYIVFQVSAINKTPGLQITQPVAGVVIRDSVVTVTGQTDPGTAVAINGQNVFVDTEGKFSTTLGVSAGQKELSVTAQNKYGKTIVQKVAVIVDTSTSDTGTAQSPAPDSKQLSMEIKFTRPTTITVTQDGVDLPQEDIPADGVKHIDAKSAVILKTSDAGGTVVTVNGKNLGPLGRTHESLTVPFTADNSLLTQPTKY